jgi:hypothetical protein
MCALDKMDRREYMSSDLSISFGDYMSPVGSEFDSTPLGANLSEFNDSVL